MERKTACQESIKDQKDLKIKAKFEDVIPGTIFIWDDEDPEVNEPKIKTNATQQPYLYLNSGNLITKYNARNSLSRLIIIKGSGKRLFETK
jgi:hypothetical protein